MWSRLGHKTRKGFKCDICGCRHHTMFELIPHIRHRHAVAGIEPLFSFGVVYGLLVESRTSA